MSLGRGFDFVPRIVFFPYRYKAHLPVDPIQLVIWEFQWPPIHISVIQPQLASIVPGNKVFTPGIHVFKTRHGSPP